MLFQLDISKKRKKPSVLETKSIKSKFINQQKIIINILNQTL
jgi:hypothetical protein